MTRVRVVIVDDEPPARARMRTTLARMPEVELVAACGDGLEAVTVIRERAPDVVLLDIQMPGLDGFGVLGRLGPGPLPVVVFVTAYDQFALRAFEAHALDYVLKPFDRRRLEAAVERALELVRMRRVGEATARLTALLADVSGPAGAAPPARTSGAYATRILVPEGEGVGFLEVERVDWCEAAGNYVRLHVGPRAYLIRRTLAALAAALDPARFVRIHRSTLVNLDRVREIQAWVGGDYLAILKDGRQLRVSRHYRTGLLRTLS